MKKAIGIRERNSTKKLSNSSFEKKGLGKSESNIKDSREEKLVINKIKRISINARRKAKVNNADVTIIRKGKIVKINPDKQERVIGTVHKNQIKVDIQKPIRIK